MWLKCLHGENVSSEILHTSKKMSIGHGTTDLKHCEMILERNEPVAL